VEGAVLELEDLDAVDALDGGADLLLVGFAGAVDDDVLVQAGGLDLESLQRRDVGPYRPDRDRQLAQHAGAVLHADTDANGIGGSGGVGHTSPDATAGPVRGPKGSGGVQGPS